MPSSNFHRFADLTTEQLRLLDGLCLDVEQRLSQGETVAIAGELSKVGRDLQQILFAELLALEIEFRQNKGQRTASADYCEAFPDYVDVIEQVFKEVDPTQRSPEPAIETTEMATQPIALDDTASTAGSSSTAGLEPIPEQFGRYQLIRPLGHGGMGAVYLAFDMQLRRQVAIKVPEFFGRPERAAAAIERFYREARAMATVEHPHLCPVYDVGEIDGRHFLSMAYLEGETLAQRIARDGSLRCQEAVAIVTTLARAIQVAHDAGIVHRDLKPANVMIRRGQPIVMDFGLASRADLDEADLTGSGDVLGSPAYMAPEQVAADHNQIGPRTDIYALGVILYELVSGRRPYEGTGMSVLSQIASGSDPIPLLSVAKVDSALDAVVSKATARKPADRYATADEMADSLASFAALRLSESATSSRGLGADDSAKRRVKVWAACIAGAVVGLALVALGGAWLLGDRGAPSAQTAIDSEKEDAKVGISDSSPRQVAPPKTLPLHQGWQEVRNIGPLVNGPKADGSPTVTPDGLSLIFHRPTAKFPHHYQLWSSVRPTKNDEFPAPQLLGPEINQLITTNPHITPSGLQLVFDSNRPGGNGGQDMWICQRQSVTDRWSQATPFSAGVNSQHQEYSPFLSHDGKTLVFMSTRPGGHGSEDIWLATRDHVTDPFGEPVNAGPHVNSPGRDGYPWLSDDGLKLLYASDREGTLGQFDLWVSTRESASGTFGSPQNLGPAVNTSHNDSHGWVSADGTLLFFESDRQGNGEYDIFVSKRDVAAASREGFAVRFDGQRAHIHVPSISRQAADPITLEAWVRPQVQQHPNVVALIATEFELEIGSHHNWHFAVEAFTDFAPPEESPRFIPGEWVHLAVVVDAKEARLYVDGSCRQTMPRESKRMQQMNIAKGLWIGGHPRPGENKAAFHFAGDIDEIRVSSIARYTESFKPITRFDRDGATLALYHCDEGHGTQLVDSSGNEHHGTINSVKWTKASNTVP